MLVSDLQDALREATIVHENAARLAAETEHTLRQLRSAEHEAHRKAYAYWEALNALGVPLTPFTMWEPSDVTRLQVRNAQKRDVLFRLRLLSDEIERVFDPNSPVTSRGGA